MTSNVADTEMHSRYRKALENLKKRIESKEKSFYSKWLKEYGLNSNSKRALTELKVIQEDGQALKWIYVNSAKTPCVDNALVGAYTQKLRDINNDYNKKAKDKKKAIITSAVSRREDVTYTKITHQKIFIGQQLEKEKLANGFLRKEEVLFFKEIYKTLEKVEIFRSL